MVQRIDVPVNKTHKLGEPAPTSTSATHMPTHVDTDPHNGLKKKVWKDALGTQSILILHFSNI